MAQAMGLPGEDELEFSRIERRRQLANMLAGDAMSPIQNHGTGMYASPISPFQGLQKMLAGYLAGRGMSKADEAQKQVVLGRQQKFDNAFERLQRMSQPGVGDIAQGQPYEPPSVAQIPAQAHVPLSRQAMDEALGADFAGLRKPTDPVSLPGVFDLPPNAAATMGQPLRQPTPEDVGGIIRAPEVGVAATPGAEGFAGTATPKAPETADAYMARARIAAREAGLTLPEFFAGSPEVKATYDRLVAEDKDRRDTQRQFDLADKNSALRMAEERAKRDLASGDITQRITGPDGTTWGFYRDGRPPVKLGNVGAEFRTIESGAGTDAKGNPQTVEKRISYIDGQPTAIDIPGVQPKSRAPLVQNTVSNKTETAYGQTFGKGVAEQDLALRDAASKAPEAAERAVRIMQILRQKPITGAGADFILGVAKALKQAGINVGDNEIAGTEELMAQMAGITLDSIRASGLGAGQGFSNADRDFLERAKGGKINMDAASLDRLARLNYKSQMVTAQKWNNRVKSIPDSALGSIGITRDPVNVPPMDVGKSAAPLSPEERRELEALERKYGGKK